MELNLLRRLCSRVLTPRSLLYFYFSSQIYSYFKFYLLSFYFIYFAEYFDFWNKESVWICILSTETQVGQKNICLSHNDEQN